MPAWTIESEHKLLLSIIKLLNISQMPKWDEVSKHLATVHGIEFSPEGCRQHFQKIRRSTGTTTVKRAGGPVGPRSASSSKPSTPAKRKGKLNLDDDVDDDEMIMTPSKKAKNVDPPVSVKRETTIKTETPVQTAHIFKTERPDSNGIVYVDLEDDESLYDNE